VARSIAWNVAIVGIPFNSRGLLERCMK